MVNLFLLTIKTTSDLSGKMLPFSAKKPKLELGWRKKNHQDYNLLRQVHGDCNDYTSLDAPRSAPFSCGTKRYQAFKGNKYVVPRQVATFPCGFAH